MVDGTDTLRALSEYSKKKTKANLMKVIAPYHTHSDLLTTQVVYKEKDVIQLVKIAVELINLNKKCSK